jgi:hypothetical protein
MAATIDAMIQGIDHLVIASPDPDAAAAELEASVGLSATGGGRHASGGTFNRIIWLADGSYLELIGVHDREAAAATPFGSAVLAVLDAGGGFVTYALLDDEVEVTANALRGDGSSIGEVVHGTRRRDDGEVVEWWYALPSGPISSASVPFLVEHAYAGREWGSTALSERAAFAHPIGSPVLLARLDIAADDPPGLAAVYHEQLGLEFWAVADLAVCNVGRHAIRLVPRREMAVPAVVTLGAQVDAPRSFEALGLRFDVEWVDLPLPAPNTV